MTDDTVVKVETVEQPEKIGSSLDSTDSVKSFDLNGQKEK